MIAPAPPATRPHAFEEAGTAQPEGRLPLRRRQTSRRYAVALASSLAALLISLWAAPELQPTSALFFAAVVVSAWYGGLGPGLVAAVVSALSLGVLLMPPMWSPALADPSDYLRAGVFLLVAILTGTLAESLHGARQHAESAAARAIESAEALRVEKLRSETILRSVSDGITVQDVNGRLVYANDAAARMMGLEAGDSLVGELEADVFSTLELNDEQERLLPPEGLPGRRALAGEERPEGLVCYRPTGSPGTRWALISARPIRDDSGEVVLAVSATHDLTDRIRYERALEANARDLHRLTAQLETTIEQLRVEREGALMARSEAEEALERTITLQRVTAALSEALTPDEVAGVVIERGIKALSARSGVLLAFSEDGGEIEIVHAAGVPRERLEEWTGSAALGARDPKAPRRGERDESDGTELSRALEEGAVSADALRRVLGTDSIALIPVTTRKRPLGVLAFDLNGRSPLTSRERELLLALGRQCAQALDRARLFAAEHRARDDAEQASLAKSQFLAVVSHELRTPLNAILGYEELLETEISGPLSSIQKHHLARIRESTRSLLSLIEQVLSLSRAQAGGPDLRLEDVDVVEMVRDAVALVEPQIRRKGLALDLVLPERAHELRTDPRKLRQIFLNMLSNAVKFTERGTVRLQLRIDDGGLSFIVQDTGPGIDAPDRERVFEPFVQVRKEGSVTSGTGLGLAVARELARQLKGDVTLDSQPGKGSTFTLQVPCDMEEEEEEEEEEDEPAGQEDALQMVTARGAGRSAHDGDRLDARVDG